MSSHHIIRENQEPALFVADYHSVSEEHLGQLLEWSPTLLTLESQYDFLQAAGIKVDVLLSSEETIENLEEHTVLIPYQQSYWEALFRYLEEKNNRNIHILCQDLDVEALRPWFGRFTMNVLSGDRKILFQKAYHKWLPKGFILEVQQIAESALDVSNVRAIANARYEVLADGFVIIPEQNEYLVISEEL